MSNDISRACQKLQDAWPLLRQDFAAAAPNRYLNLTQVDRSPEEQFADYQKGRALAVDGVTWEIVNHGEIITNVDGYKIVGKHNRVPSEAIDVVVMDNQTGKPVWEAEAYFPLGPIAEKYGLVWGGNWISLKDYPHLEVPKEI